MTLVEMNWAKGYVRQARWLKSLRKIKGWAVGKGEVKHTITLHRNLWMRRTEITPEHAGMIDALLDSVGC